MLSVANIRWFYGLTGLFVAALGVALYTEHYEVAAVPVVLGVLWAAFFSHLRRVPVHCPVHPNIA